MCDININELHGWNEREKQSHFNQLKRESEEQFKKQEFIKAGQIEKKVCLKFDKSPEQLRIHTRKREILEPRQVAMKLICENTGLIEEDIAWYFGFNRSTINHAKSNINMLTIFDKDLRGKVEEIEGNL